VAPDFAKSTPGVQGLQQPAVARSERVPDLLVDLPVDWQAVGLLVGRDGVVEVAAVCVGGADVFAAACWSAEAACEQAAGRRATAAEP